MGKQRKQAHVEKVVKVDKTALDATESGDETALEAEGERPPVDYSNEIISKQASLALLYLLFYSILMFTLPFGAFYGTRYTLEHHYDVEGFKNTCFSVIAAVLTANIIIFAYAYQAYHEPEYDNSGNKVDQHAIPDAVQVPNPKKKKLKPSKDL